MEAVGDGCWQKSEGEAMWQGVWRYSGDANAEPRLLVSTSAEGDGDEGFTM